MGQGRQTPLGLSSYSPSLQVKQYVLFGSEICLLSMHWKHVVIPVFGAYACSPTHFVHVLAAETLVYLPAMHMLQAVAPAVE
jgi:hypothetical protein